MIRPSGSGKKENWIRPLSARPTERTKIVMAVASVAQRLLRAKVTVGRNTLSLKWAKPLSSRARAGVTLYPSARRNECRRWPGRTRKHSTREAIITQITTKGISNNISPIMPPISIRGRKVAAVDSIAERTGANILRAPPSAASRLLSPLCR